MMFPWDTHLIACRCGCYRNVDHGSFCESCGDEELNGGTVFGMSVREYQDMILNEYPDFEEYIAWDYHVWAVS